MTTANEAGATPAAVAAKATIPGVLALGEVTVIGVFGPESALRALIRMPGGRIREVERGARLSIGAVAGIDRKGVMIQRGGKTRRLALPGG